MSIIRIGNLTEEQKNVLFDQFFSKPAKMPRLQRLRQRKQALEEQLTSLLAIDLSGNDVGAYCNTPLPRISANA